MPGCNGTFAHLRIRIDNSSAHVDLNKKFGAAREQALELLLKARDAGLDAAGIAFHVGSQTTSADPYLYALDIAREIFEEAAAAGMQLRIMDIGGGFPIPEPKVRFNLQEIRLTHALTKIFREWKSGRSPGVLSAVRQ